jgi:hypothetical protein
MTGHNRTVKLQALIVFPCRDRRADLHWFGMAVAPE